MHAYTCNTCSWFQVQCVTNITITSTPPQISFGLATRENANDLHIPVCHHYCIYFVLKFLKIPPTCCGFLHEIKLNPKCIIGILSI